jgi:hypothetical protein
MILLNREVSKSYLAMIFCLQSLVSCFPPKLQIRSSIAVKAFSSIDTVSEAPVDLILPFLSEHIQLSDQMLFCGASTDMALKLSKIGYGTSYSGYILCVDNNTSRLDECRRRAASDPILSKNILNNRLRFSTVDYTKMPEVCKSPSQKIVRNNE